MRRALHRPLRRGPQALKRQAATIGNNGEEARVKRRKRGLRVENSLIEI
jgi:hypothetical protein